MIVMNFDNTKHVFVKRSFSIVFLKKLHLLEIAISLVKLVILSKLLIHLSSRNCSVDIIHVLHMKLDTFILEFTIIAKITDVKMLALSFVVVSFSANMDISARFSLARVEVANMCSFASSFNF